MRNTRHRLVFALLALAIPLIVAGCGTSNSDTNSSASGSSKAKTATPGINESKSAEVAAKVPKSIASAGTLTVAADATYAPDEFIAPDGHTVVGMDADLAKAIAQEMGLKPDVKNVTFDAIIPGLAANKYDLGMSSFTVTKERLKTVDFVTYAQAGTSFFVKAQGGPNIQSLADLCGESVAAEKGTTQESDATAQDKKCKSGGKSGVTVQVFPDENAVNLALSSGRATVGMADSPVASYAVQQSNGQFKLSGKPYGAAAYGIAMPKGNGMAPAVLAAVKELMKDGTYQKIFAYWGLTAGTASSGCPCTITNPQINPTNVPAS